MTKTDLELIPTEQNLYDAFNGFIISDDLKVFGKLLARSLLFNQVREIPGDIVECGVFKGSGFFTFLKLKRYLCPNTSKKVIGFDIFDTDELTKNLISQDKDAMSSLFKLRDFEHNSHYVDYLSKLIKEAGFLDHEYEFVVGDISITAADYADKNPGFKISLLYLDLDLEHPTYDTLCALWDRVSNGGGSLASSLLVASASG